MTSTPYTSAARDYLAGGWSPLPIKAGGKTPAVSGFHGLQAPMATPADVERWATAHGALNVALRLPDGVVGIDVDTYGDKDGAAQLAALEATHGALPWSPLSTSRDTSSGIRFYRIPAGIRTGSKVAGADDIDAIAHGIRYAVAAPSVHPSGRVYLWLDPITGEETPAPQVGDLPDLPESWLPLITSNRTDTADVSARLDEAPDGPVSDDLNAAVHHYRTLVESGTASRRDVLEVTRLLAKAMASGEKGTPTAHAEAAALHESHRPGRSGDFEKMLGDALTYEDGLAPVATAFVLVAPDAGDDLEERFWSARPELTTVRDFARSRLMPPWMVLGAVLCNVVSTVPPSFRLPPVIGSEQSLNIMVALVGGSSGGKSASMALAEEVLGFHPEAPSVNPGTGEGLVRQYVETRTEKGEDGVPRTESVQVAQAVRFVVDEIDTLAAVGKGRSGATILPVLRSAWSGSALGFATASRESRVRVEPHTYRFTLIAGVQPRRAEWLVGDEADGGTPQRFLWLPGDDPGARGGVPTPEPLGWSPVNVGGVIRHMRVPAEVREHTQDLRLRQLRGESSDRLDGHANLVRIKVAAALAFLAGRFTMTVEDWHLAGLLMEVSSRTRASVVHELREASEEVNRKGAVARGVGDALAGEARDDLMVKRASAGIRARLAAGDQLKRGDLRRGLRSQLRPYFDEAVAALVTTGLVDEVADGESPAYRLAA